MTVREQLQALNATPMSPEAHIEAVAALAQATGHTMVSLASASDLFGYTCAVYALNLVDDPDYDRIRHRWRTIYAGAEFMNWVMHNARLELLHGDEVAPGSLAVYRDDQGAFTHVGIVRAGNRIDSKFGQLGLYNHALGEVPTDYGDRVRYFRGLQRRESITLFFEFAREKGAEF